MLRQRELCARLQRSRPDSYCAQIASVASGKNKTFIGWVVKHSGALRHFSRRIAWSYVYCIHCVRRGLLK